MNKMRDLLKGFTDTLPVGISVAIYGLVYGVLGGKTGLTVFEVAALSMFVFAGASQIAAVQMIALGSNPISIIITIFIVNLRHYLMAASISPFMEGVSTRLRMLCSFFMTDESYAVTYSHFQKNKPSSWYFLGSGLNIYILWGMAGIVGYLFGNAIPANVGYIFDFAFVAAFIGMLLPMVKDIPVIMTVLASIIISLLGSKYLPGKWYIIFAGIGSSLIGFLTLNVLQTCKIKKSVCSEVMGNE